jgi:homocysteine S-methyltransferase
MKFRERLSDPRPILLDGATGTELNIRGVPTRLPLWSAWALLESPETLEAIHLDYLQAGAEVLTANTFRTHRRNLEAAGMGARARELTGLAVEIARRAIERHRLVGGGHAWVAGSLAPLEDCYSPDLVPPQAQVEAEHSEMATNLASAGADLILIETMNTIREAKAAARSARATGLPFVVSFVLRTDGNLFSGEPLEQAVEAVSPHAPDLMGINCTPSTMITEALLKLQGLTAIPVSGYGNIGHVEDIVGWETTEDVSPAGYGALAARWAKMGIRMIGGCCGTGPEHIRQSVRKIQLSEVG